MKNLRIEKLKSFSLAALLMAGAAFAACSSDDNITEEQPVSPTGEQVYKLTIKASNGGDATTRALKLETSGALTAYWEVNDVLTVTKGTTALTSTLKCTAVNGDEATFEGTITGEVSANDALTLHYHMPTGFSVYAAQTGTLASAAARDYATATVTVDGVDATTHEGQLHDTDGRAEADAAGRFFKHDRTLLADAVGNDDLYWAGRTVRRDRHFQPLGQSMVY